MIRRFILVRHGESEENRLNASHYSRIGGQFNSPLSEVGRQQARRLQQSLPALGEDIIALSSPSPRAIETACLALDCLPPHLSVLPELHERNLGPIEGHALADLQQNPTYANFFAQDQGRAYRHSFELALPGAESYRDVVARTRAGLLNSVAALTPAVHTVMVFSHMVTIRCMLYWMLNLTEEQTLALRINNAQPIVLEYQPTPVAGGRLIEGITEGVLR